MITRRNGLAAFQQPELSDEEDNDEPEDSSGEEDDGEDVAIEGNLKSPRKGREKLLVEGQSSNIIVQTAFDAYFTYNKPGRVQTSSNIFSDLLLPLSSEEYAEAFNEFKLTQSPIKPTLLKADNLSSFFSRIICELDEGFNILCYGLGSKRRLLNQFARDWCSKRGHVVVANGFQPDFSLKDLLNSIEDTPALQSLDLPSTNIEKQVRRIYDFFVSSKFHLYLVIHNIDSAPLRAQKAKSILSLLAHHPKIHITASIDHINAPLMWSSSEMFSRKPEVIQPGITPSRGFAWLWHDLTTLQPYDFELAFADRSSLSGAHTGGARRKADALAAQNVTAMTETAASHILASVTQKAQKLFVLVANKQLEAIEGADEGSGTGNLQQFGMGYDVLFSTARDNFIATNDTALRALLGEFRDHSLIVSAQAGAGGGEVLWIPMRKERLANVLKTLDPL